MPRLSPAAALQPSGPSLGRRSESRSPRQRGGRGRICAARTLNGEPPSQTDTTWRKTLPDRHTMFNVHIRTRRTDMLGTKELRRPMRPATKRCSEIAPPPGRVWGGKLYAGLTSGTSEGPPVDKSAHGRNHDMCGTNARRLQLGSAAEAMQCLEHTSHITPRRAGTQYFKIQQIRRHTLPNLSIKHPWEHLLVTLSVGAQVRPKCGQCLAALGTRRAKASERMLPATLVQVGVLSGRPTKDRRGGEHLLEQLSSSSPPPPPSAGSIPERTIGFEILRNTHRLPFIHL